MGRIQSTRGLNGEAGGRRNTLPSKTAFTSWDVDLFLLLDWDLHPPTLQFLIL